MTLNRVVTEIEPEPVMKGEARISQEAPPHHIFLLAFCSSPPLTFLRVPTQVCTHSPWFPLQSWPEPCCFSEAATRFLQAMWKNWVMHANPENKHKTHLSENSTAILPSRPDVGVPVCRMMEHLLCSLVPSRLLRLLFSPSVCRGSSSE